MGETLQNRDTNGSSKAIYNKYSYEVQSYSFSCAEDS